MLLIHGDLDVITPMPDATRAAALVPERDARPPSAIHVTALADFDECAARIVRDVIRARAVGDTRCASTLAELHVVPAFPRTTARAPPASPAAGDRSNRGDRRAGWAAAHTVADAMSRWWLMYGYDGRGLRGGTFETGDDHDAFHPVTFRFAKTRARGAAHAARAVSSAPRGTQRRKEGTPWISWRSRTGSAWAGRRPPHGSASWPTS